ncbi:hypothetical protein QQ045_006248 [Rhodiola kirilowii]
MTSFRSCPISTPKNAVESNQSNAVNALRSKIRRVRCAMEEIRATPRREGGQDEHIRVDQTDPRKKPSANCQTLPDDLIREIFSRLPASSIVRFKYLNKSFNSLIQSKQFIKLQLHRTVENINETRRWRVLMSICRNPALSIRVEGLDKFGSQVGHVVDKSGSEEALLRMDISDCIPMSRK